MQNSCCDHRNFDSVNQPLYFECLNPVEFRFCCKIGQYCLSYYFASTLQLSYKAQLPSFNRKLILKVAIFLDCGSTTTQPWFNLFSDLVKAVAELQHRSFKIYPIWEKLEAISRKNKGFATLVNGTVTTKYHCLNPVLVIAILYGVISLNRVYSFFFNMKYRNTLLACMVVRARVFYLRDYMVNIHFGHMQCLLIIGLQLYVRRVLPVRLYQIQQVSAMYLNFLCSNTGSIIDDPYWTSRDNSLELIELSSINKVSLV